MDDSSTPPSSESSAITEPSKAESAASPPGYRSQADKKRLVIIVCILAVLFYGAQKIVPKYFNSSEPFLAVEEIELKDHEISHSAIWGGRIWYTADTSSLAEGTKSVLFSLPLSGERLSQEVSPLTIAKPWLVAGQDRLWMVSDNSVAFYKNGAIEVLNTQPPLTESSRPFIYNGQLAVVEKKWPGHCLKVLENGIWQVKDSFMFSLEGSMKSSGENLQVFQAQDTIHLYFRPHNSDKVYYRRGLPGVEGDTPSAWEPVVRSPGSWRAAWLGDRPAVFYHGLLANKGEFVIGCERSGQTWVQFFKYPVEFFDFDLGICHTGPGKDFLLLRRSVGSPAEIIAIKDGKPEWRHTLKGSLGMTSKGRKLLNVSEDGDILAEITGIKDGKLEISSLQKLQKLSIGIGSNDTKLQPIARVGIILIVVVFLIVMSTLMKQYRVVQYTSGEQTVHFASLARRSIAAIIDIIPILGAFAGIKLTATKLFLSQQITIGTTLTMIHNAGIVGITLATVVFFVFSFLEGQWGLTPGKWIVGLRVLKSDLKPCGMGRGLLRNLVRPLDFFGTYIVGMAAMAVTAKWQRLGDLAAGTIVIRRIGGKYLPGSDDAKKT